MGKRLVKFTFPAERVTEPIIYQLSRKFELLTNIRRADVSESIGWEMLELDGT